MAWSFPSWKSIVYGKIPQNKALYNLIKYIYEHTGVGGTVGTNEIEDAAVTTDKVHDAAITLGKLAAASVNTEKLIMFVSTEQTGTGEAQSIAHNLSVSPATVLIIPTLIPADGMESDYTKGTSNINATVTTGAKYVVVAIA